MIPWWWMIPAIVSGAVFAVAMIALMFAGRDD